MPQPSTLNRNPALGTSNIALNNTAPVNRIKEETVEGIFPLKRPAYSPGRKDNPKQGSSSKRAAKWYHLYQNKLTDCFFILLNFFVFKFISVDFI